MQEWGGSVRVVQVQTILNEDIVSDFKGFNNGAKFEFRNSQVWEQAEYKYSYHYAYRPAAIIIDGLNGKTLHVDEMAASVKVRRIK